MGLSPFPQNQNGPFTPFTIAPIAAEGILGPDLAMFMFHLLAWAAGQLQYNCGTLRTLFTKRFHQVAALPKYRGPVNGLYVVY